MPRHNVGHKQAREHETRNDACHEQLDNALVYRHAINNQRQRRWDHQAKRGGPCQCTNDHIFRITALAQLWDRHFANRGERRCRRAGHSCKNRASRDIRVQQSSGQPTHPWGQSAKHVLR